MTSRRVRRTLFGLAVASAATSALPGDAHAGGLYFSDRGVRPLGRGGAFVAGADDLGAIWYNPAGVVDAGSQFLLDAGWLNFGAEFTRRARVVDGSGAVRIIESPTVRGTTPILPIPTIAGSLELGKKKDLVIAGGVYAPYAAISSYPLTVDTEPAASRYMLVSMDGSALAVVGGYVAYRPFKELRIGAGLEALVGKFASTIVFNAAPPDRLLAAPEDPSYDAFSRLEASPIFAPSGSLGATVEPDPHLRLGLSGHLPVWVNAPASVQIRLPTAAPFDRGSIDGDEARVKFTLPAILRAGIEYRQALPKEAYLRVEAAYVREFWSMHETIRIEPRGIQLTGVTGFPSPFGVGPMELPRSFQDSNSFRLGGEYSFKGLVSDYRLDLRAGVAYETSAVPPGYVTALTIDTNKWTLGVGGGLYVGQRWRFDAAFAYLITPTIDVDPAAARVGRVNPVQGNPTPLEAINGGTYNVSALVLGVGLRYQFGDVGPKPEEKKAPPPAETAPPDAGRPEGTGAAGTGAAGAGAAGAAPPAAEPPPAAAEPPPKPEPEPPPAPAKKPAKPKPKPKKGVGDMWRNTR